MSNSTLIIAKILHHSVWAGFRLLGVSVKVHAPGPTTDRKLQGLAVQAGCKPTMKVTLRTVTGTSFSLDLDDKSKVGHQASVLLRKGMLHTLRIALHVLQPDCAGVRCQSEASARQRRCVPGGASSIDLSGQGQLTSIHISYMTHSLS